MAFLIVFAQNTLRTNRLGRSRLEVVKHPAAKKGFVLLPRRWVVERTFGWIGRFRRLARDYERLAKVLAGWHGLAYLTLLLGKLNWESA